MKQLIFTKTIFLLAIFTIFFSFFAGPIFAQQDATGANAIFEYIGVDRPANWAEMNRSEKFAYLAELGLSPNEDGHYQGEVEDLSGYFAKLGVAQPANWDNMTFEQRKQFVSQAGGVGDAMPESQASIPDSSMQAGAETDWINPTTLAVGGVVLAVVFAGSVILMRKNN